MSDHLPILLKEFSFKLLLSTEVEYCDMYAACSKILWLCGLLFDLKFSQKNSTPLHEDNTIAIQITENSVFTSEPSI